MSSVAESRDSLLEMKREKFVRSASLEKIIRFNAYICSQNYYYILPAILAWLKTSQTILQSSVERTIFFFKSLFFGNLILQLVQENVKTTGGKLDFFAFKAQDAMIVANLLIASAVAALGDVKSVAKDLCLRAVVYASLVAIFAQLALCVYFMASVHLPGGFLFLLSCLLMVCNMCHQQLRSHLKKAKRAASKKNLPNRTGGGGQRPQKRLSRRDILGGRTISTFNLF